ncbi:VTT domain-containing protein [Clostridium oryzae]|uniref:Inner membrane protein YqjA n=1 Tax=Clostridium oryzae TaxID=1450648 RepID=A0A1V4IW05_9CLOT|nr:VTT domain-containing protein [Clostridium oryzae]OPJ63964.1 inner membrane protein YqjA [Clostridium oryzae]
MEFIGHFLNIVLHVDKYMNLVIRDYGNFTYLLLFVVILIETGVVIMPILPGDSVLFITGAFAAIGSFNIALLIIIVYAAAVIGDTMNYHIGKYIGRKIYDKEKVRFLKKEYLYKTQTFYEKYGAKTIIIARFMPIIRTFAPFVAGIGKMKYTKFLLFNMIGAGAWVLLLTLSGYFFGNIPVVKNNFTYVIYGIVFVSVLPSFIVVLKQKLSAKYNGKDKKEIA